MGTDMLTFKEYTEASPEEVDEALTMQQRTKAKSNFRKNKGKIAAGKRRAEKKIASPEKLKARSQKQARKEVEKKILKGKSKDELSFAARQALEKKVDKKAGLIARIAKKNLPAVKKAELERKRGGSGGDSK